MSSPGAPWIERVPRFTLVSFASAVLALSAIAFALFAAHRSNWSGWAEPLLAAVALAVLLLSPVRLGPALALATLAAFVVVDVAGHGARGGVPAADIGLAFLLVTSLLSASYLRLGLRRRETELEIAQQAIGKLTQRDRVTNLLAGPRQFTWLDTELARARRHHHQLSLVLIRPDGIDALADGREEIELEVLEATAEVIGNELRATDVALRYDPQTFALILPETTSEGARVAAERIRLLLPQRVGAGANLTVSSGIALFPRDASSNEELTDAAARALARALQLGGNRTVLSSVDEGVPLGWALSGPRGESASS